MTNLLKLLSSRGKTSVNRLGSTLRTPVSRLSNRAKATGILSGLGAGAALGHEMGQPILEALKHSNPEGFLSKAEILARRAELEAGAQAANLARAQGFLDDALASAEKYKSSKLVGAEVDRVVNASRQRVMGTLNNYLERKGGERLFPRAAELSGILAQARASEILQDAAKAVPIVGPGADVSQLVRNLTITNSLSNPEVVSSITSSYKPILEGILPKAQRIVDSSVASVSPAAKAQALESYEALLSKTRAAPRGTLDEVRQSLSTLRDPRAALSSLVDPNRTIPTRLQEALDLATKRIDTELVRADRSLSPAVELLRANSPGIPVPSNLSLNSATALAATRDAVQRSLIAPAAEATTKIITKALGKQIPGLGWTYGLIDSGGSMGSKAVFDKYVSGALGKPGGNMLVDKYYYTPNANAVYTRLTQPGGAVDKLYDSSLDSGAIVSMGKTVLPESLHKFLPKSTS